MLEKVRQKSKIIPDADRRSFLDTQKGVSNGHQDGKTDFSKHLRSRTPSLDESESLSDVDDFEVLRYLHSKEEMHYKKIIWEELNREHAKVRHGKRAAETKKDAPARKASKIAVKTANEKRLSSRINYDALEKLNAELSERTEKANEEGPTSNSGDGDFELSGEAQEFGRSERYIDELEGTDFDEGVETCGDYDATPYYEHEEDEYGHGHDEVYDEDG